MPTTFAHQAIGFDLGETLLTYADTPLSWVDFYRPALERACAACSIVPAEHDYGSAEAILRKYNTRLHARTQEIPAEKIFEEIFCQWRVPAPSTTLRDTAIRAFFSFFQQRLRAYEESRATLVRLRAAGVCLGLLTDVPYGMPRDFVLEDLANARLADLFDVILTSVDVGFRKPDPCGFVRLASELGVTPREMIYVGNEEKDIVGANAAGCRSYLIDREKTGRRFAQEKTVYTLSELAPLV